ncbi:hypothetical protein [Spartinivicinus poritis]|uniref:Uncharacterized protein n=1 Tax=Spartinivicinus poritis TaxID=2994640 RepID=A0ABT5UH11_9GAMM|nr:hypothetical protein [Spartinivicinus sp. A2-2]MDE1465682.1 hypothetical protein [Spartinivicinus sp. A2-2]
MDQDDSLKFSNLATIYRFKKSDYKKIKEKFKRIYIIERLNISAEDQNISKSNSAFEIFLTDGTMIKPEYVDATLADHSKNELVIESSLVNFKREIIMDKKLAEDLSFVYRVH